MSTTSAATRDRAEPRPAWRSVVRRTVPAVPGLGFATVLTTNGTQGLAQPPPTAGSQISVTQALLTERDGPPTGVPRGPVDLAFTVRNSYALPVPITAVDLGPISSRSCQTRVALDPATTKATEGSELGWPQSSSCEEPCASPGRDGRGSGRPDPSPPRSDATRAQPNVPARAGPADTACRERPGGARP